MDNDDLMPNAEDLEFAGVTSRYAEIDGVQIDPMKIPEPFRHLTDVAKFWSIGDDVERSSLMWLTPREELRAFVKAVQPFENEIFNWCSQCKQIPRPDEIVIFEMMLDAAAGARACFVDVEE